MATDAGAARPACPLCGGGGERAVVYRLRPFDVVRCPACGGLQRDPLPDQQEMESYYRDAAYLGGTYFSEAAAGPEAALHREALDWLAARRRARGLATTGRLLDVGAGSGAFLAAARRQGWDAQGLEISPELADRAQAHSGAVVRTGDFASMALADGAFDCVAMWDVLEHCLDPGVFLDRACSLLAPGGVLVILTIDAASLFNAVAHAAWKASGGRVVRPLELLYDKRHNHYFTRATLRGLLQRHGLRVAHESRHRAHLGRWLSEPASPLLVAGAGVLDWIGMLVRRPYRQLLFCEAA